MLLQLPGIPAQAADPVGYCCRAAAVGSNAGDEVKVGAPPVLWLAPRNKSLRFGTDNHAGQLPHEPLWWAGGSWRPFPGCQVQRGLPTAYSLRRFEPRWESGGGTLRPTRAEEELLPCQSCQRKPGDRTGDDHVVRVLRILLFQSQTSLFVKPDIGGDWREFPAELDFSLMQTEVTELLQGEQYLIILHPKAAATLRPSLRQVVLFDLRRNNFLPLVRPSRPFQSSCEGDAPVRWRPVMREGPTNIVPAPPPLPPPSSRSSSTYSKNPSPSAGEEEEEEAEEAGATATTEDTTAEAAAAATTAATTAAAPAAATAAAAQNSSLSLPSSFRPPPPSRPHHQEQNPSSSASTSGSSGSSGRRRPQMGPLLAAAKATAQRLCPAAPSLALSGYVLEASESYVLLIAPSCRDGSQRTSEDPHSDLHFIGYDGEVISHHLPCQCEHLSVQRYENYFLLVRDPQEHPREGGGIKGNVMDDDWHPSHAGVIGWLLSSDDVSTPPLPVKLPENILQCSFHSHAANAAAADPLVLQTPLTPAAALLAGSAGFSACSGCGRSWSSSSGGGGCRCRGCRVSFSGSGSGRGVRQAPEQCRCGHSSWSLVISRGSLAAGGHARELGLSPDLSQDMSLRLFLLEEHHSKAFSDSLKSHKIRDSGDWASEGGEGQRQQQQQQQHQQQQQKLQQRQPTQQQLDRSRTRIESGLGGEEDEIAGVEPSDVGGEEAGGSIYLRLWASRRLDDAFDTLFEEHTFDGPRLLRYNLDFQCLESSFLEVPTAAESGGTWLLVSPEVKHFARLAPASSGAGAGRLAFWKAAVHYHQPARDSDWWARQPGASFAPSPQPPHAALGRFSAGPRDPAFTNVCTTSARARASRHRALATAATFADWNGCSPVQLLPKASAWDRGGVPWEATRLPSRNARPALVSGLPAFPSVRREDGQFSKTEDWWIHPLGRDPLLLPSLYSMY